MPLSKSDFFNQKIFEKIKLNVIRSNNAGQVVEIQTWYKTDEYKLIKKTRAYLLDKKKLNDTNCTEEITFDLVQRIIQWRKGQQKVCHYCGIQESVLDQLNNQSGHQNKRWPKRGKSLEIDRKQSAYPYSQINNLVLACYWCNNAKTDTFTYKEFREIGRSMNRIWKGRLGMEFKIPAELIELSKDEDTRL